MTILDDLIRDEGLILHAYQDSLGFWTIGIGRMIDKRNGGGITEAEARTLCLGDVHDAMAELELHCPWWSEMTEARQRGLLNMCFALGWPRLSGFHRMLTALADGDYLTAAKECQASEWASQVGERATRIARLFSEG